MGSVTSLGYPYPIGTDRVMDGDNAIQALAERINSHVGVLASGVVPVTIATAGTVGTAAVTFPVGRFTVAPNVTVTPQTGQPQNNAASVSTASATGMNVAALRSTSGTLNVSVAGPPARLGRNPRMATVICHTEGCENNGAAIELELSYRTLTRAKP